MVYGMPNASAVWRARSERADDELVDGTDALGRRLGLEDAEVVERLVQPTLQPAGRVQRGATVADEDQHDAKCPTALAGLT